LRIAIIADIHGNSIALEAVLDAIRASGEVDEYWVLGDLAAIGPDPVRVLERLSQLPKARFIRGNTDRYLVRDEIPGPGFDQVFGGERRLAAHIRMARNFAWTTGAVGASGWLPWLEKLPLDFRVSLPDGTRVLAVHASPGTEDGRGIHPGTPDDDLERLIAGAQADLIFIAHTHLPLDRTAGKARVVNPGSVSNPFPPDLRACYLLLEAGEAGYSLDFRQVDYDHEAVVQAARQVHHPAADYITGYMRGQNRPDWMKKQT
jgi:predicted phosphodiesterase